jgi:hypothetical protein
MDKIICDKCEHYTVSAGGSSESCWEHKSNPNYLTMGYFEERQTGEKTNCKGYKKLRNNY